MSLVHMGMNLIKNDSDFAEYAIEAADFNEERNWEIFCIAKIDKSRGVYEIRFCEGFDSDHFIPPILYSYDEKDREFLLRTKYKDYAYGAWSRLINKWLKQLIHKKYYPDKYPTI